LVFQQTATGDATCSSSDVETEDSPPVRLLEENQPMCVIKDTYYTQNAEMPSGTSQSAHSTSSKGLSQFGKISAQADSNNFDSHDSGISTSTVFPICITRGEDTVQVVLNNSFEQITAALSDEDNKVDPMAVPISGPIPNTKAILGEETKVSATYRSRGDVVVRVSG
jgi:hypothetical protein